jgi:hypothetical protein
MNLIICNKTMKVPDGFQPETHNEGTVAALLTVA